jgi:hypothetical protein
MRLADALWRVVLAAKGLARLLVAAVLLLLETSGIGRRLYFLPRQIPRDRDEVAANPEKFFRLAQRSGAVPKAAKFRGIVLHEPDAASMSDPSKAQRTFLATIAFALDGAEASTTTLCVKTGRFRGPWVLQLILAARAGGHFSRERAFYEHVAPSLRHAAVPRCFHADVLGLLTHTFFLLEGVEGVVCHRESEPFDDGVARAFLAAEAKVHRQWWDDDAVDVNGTPSLAALDGSVFGGLLNGVMPKIHRPLLHAIVLYTHGRRCGQGLLHGDARLGNALFASGTNGMRAGRRAAVDVTLVDWEVAQRGPCLFDVLYFLWLCVDPVSESSHEETMQTAVPSSKEDCERAGAYARACGLLSERDWSLLLHWQQHLDLPHDPPHGAEHAPLEEQVAVMSLLIAAYMLAVGKLGFANVWKDGNNSADLGAWGRRVQSRVEALCANRGALRLAAKALDAEAPVEGGWEAQLMKVIEQMEERRGGRAS